MKDATPLMASHYDSSLASDTGTYSASCQYSISRSADLSGDRLPFTAPC